MSDWLVTVPRDLPQLLKGASITIRLLTVGLVFGTSIGLATALVRTYGPRWLCTITNGFIELFRGTPLVVQMFLIYYGLPDVGITLSAMLTAYITLSLNSGAYQSDYFRGAIQAVGQGQMMAARALGMSRLSAITNIILPQALRLVIPAWATEPITLLKVSAVAFLIGLPDIMGQAKIIASRTFQALPSYFTVTLMYLVMVYALTLLFGYLERKVRIPGFEMGVVER